MALVMDTKLISLKKRYPFRLAAPSFIYPADYATNAKRLAPFLDEIELLLFESSPDSLPSRRQVNDLALIAADASISYNVHLPIDIELALPGKKEQHRMASLLAACIDRVTPLQPTTYTLHLVCKEEGSDPAKINCWQQRAAEGLNLFLSLIAVPARKISVETLDYPPHWLMPVVNTHDVSVCLDIGHLIRYGFDLFQTWQAFSSKTTIIHLHGVSGGRDHLELDKLSNDALSTVVQCLHHFRGSLSLEVFSLERLARSLNFFARIMPPQRD